MSGCGDSPMKSMKIWFVLFAAVLACGILGSVWVLQKPEGSIVEIVQDGEVLYRLDLAAYRESETLEIEYNGGVNILRIEDGKIRMQYADCPDQTCVKAGWLQSSSLPIVCLPHHLVIQYTENGGGEDGIAN